MTGFFDFVGLGYCCLDHLCRVEEIPLDHKVKAREHLTQGGGLTATACVTAARLGLKSAFVGVAGNDISGEIVRRGLEAEGVSTDHLHLRENCSTATAYCWIDAAGGRSIVWHPCTGADLTDDELPESLIAHAKVLHLDGYHPAVALKAAKVAKRHGVLVNIDADSLRDGVLALFPYVDVLIASEFCAKQFAGEGDPEAQLAKLVEVGAEVTGITLGARGSICYDRKQGKTVFCPAFSNVPIVDTTGAGDVYHAAFGIKYQSCRDVCESMRFASAVAALKCGKFGGRTGIPTAAEAEAFLRHQTATAGK